MVQASFDALRRCSGVGEPTAAYVVSETEPPEAVASECVFEAVAKPGMFHREHDNQTDHAEEESKNGQSKKPQQAQSLEKKEDDVEINAHIVLPPVEFASSSLEPCSQLTHVAFDINLSRVTVEPDAR